jgi:hypothetical protein
MERVKAIRIPKSAKLSASIGPVSHGDVMFLAGYSMNFKHCDYGCNCRSINTLSVCTYLHATESALLKVSEKIESNVGLTPSEKSIKLIVQQVKSLLEDKLCAKTSDPSTLFQASVFDIDINNTKISMKESTHRLLTTQLTDSPEPVVNDLDQFPVLSDTDVIDEIKLAIQHSLNEQSTADAKSKAEEDELAEVLKLSIQDTGRSAAGGGPVGPRIYPKSDSTHRNIQLMKDYPSLMFGSLIGRKGVKWQPVQCMTTFKLSPMSESCIIEGGFEEYGRFE